MRVQSPWVLGLMAVVAICAGCDTSTSYRQEIELAPGETGLAEISMDLRENCTWGQSCGDYDYMSTSISLRLIEPMERRDVEWKGVVHSPVFLGRIDGDLYLVLFARQCFDTSDGWGNDARTAAAHPVYRWTHGQWERVPYQTIPEGTEANLFYLLPTKVYDGRTFSLDEVRGRLETQRENVYAKAAAELDFDKWYGLIFSRCAKPHDRY